MKRSQSWRPSKYTMVGGRLSPSLDREELAPSSRLMAVLLTRKYQPALSNHARGRLLDLGCGKVPFYAAYRDYVSENICVDWPNSPHGGEHLDLHCDLTKRLPFDDGEFDTVLSSDVLEHLPDPELAFREMGRILKPGGKLILNTPFLYMLHEIPFDFYRHSRYSLERLAEAADFEVVQLDEIGGACEVLADLVGKMLSVIPGVGATVAIAVQRVAAAFATTSLGLRSQKASAARFPLGYFMVAVRRSSADASSS